MFFGMFNFLTFRNKRSVSVFLSWIWSKKRSSSVFGVESGLEVAQENSFLRYFGFENGRKVVQKPFPCALGFEVVEKWYKKKRFFSVFWSWKWSVYGQKFNFLALRKAIANNHLAIHRQTVRGWLVIAAWCCTRDLFCYKSRKPILLSFSPKFWSRQQWQRFQFFAVVSSWSETLSTWRQALLKERARDQTHLRNHSS